MPRDSQTSFSGGELDPGLHSHADLAKYQSGLALVENWFVLAQGGLATRPGFEYVVETIDSSSAARVIPFQFNTEQGYALVFTDQAMRVIRNGAVVLESAGPITAASTANPVVITQTGHGYSTNDDVFIDNCTGMTEINGQFHRITVLSPNTYELNGVDGTGFSSYTGSGTASRVFTLTTPYTAVSLFRLKFTQTNDVMTITHPGYQQRELSRTGHAAWTLSGLSFASSISPPSAGFFQTNVGTASGSPNKTYRYVVTSVSEDGSESVASAIQSLSCNALSETYGIRTSWTTVAGASYYNVYKEFSLNSGIFGWIGEADEDGSPSFDDYNFGPDMSVTPPEARNPFAGADDYPACVTFHQQRRWFGGTNNNPQTFWATRTADFDNMDTSRPTRADDAIEATLVAGQSNEIRHLLSMDDLLMFTSGAEYKIVGDADGILTPTNVYPRRQTVRGSSHLAPLVVGETALYVQEKASRVRDLRYTFEADRFVGDDLTILARHMFEQHEIVDWCYAQEPFSIVWAVRDDGTLLSMTYVREHNIYGWTRHTTDGVFESVCAVSEGSEDAVYAIVKRNINGQDKRFVERLHSRFYSSEIDAFCVDAGLTYDGAATTTVTGLWHLEGEDVAVLADGNVVEGLTVVDGSITLPWEAEKVHIGLGYICDFQTLEVAVQGAQLQSRKKQVGRLSLRVKESRGLAAGSRFDRLYEFKERTQAMNYNSIPLQTIELRSLLGPGWSDTGEVCVRQKYPLPATVVAAIPELEVSG